MDRDTNNLRATRRLTIGRNLVTPQHRKKFDLEKMEIQEIESDEDSRDISEEDDYSYAIDEEESVISSEISQNQEDPKFL